MTNEIFGIGQIEGNIFSESVLCPGNAKLKDVNGLVEVSRRCLFSLATKAQNH